ncbi:HTH domain-containing protein [Salmonella enterica subsp. enterica]|nr:HTH domain-containing protein [Salmonella enterica subsp. enterica]
MVRQRLSVSTRAVRADIAALNALCDAALIYSPAAATRYQLKIDDRRYQSCKRSNLRGPRTWRADTTAGAFLTSAFSR